ncbi:MAG: YggS family pyridoxal phosphate-dependent enzyme [Clostridia bacterium]|nr:YggS family pyridoxal phosphate-dependent enzyme [Clostridia bacterium]
MADVKTQLEFVENEIEKAKKRAGREDGVTLIAVTKTHGVDLIREAYDHGCSTFGENRVQEMMDKFDSFPEASWHLIGHLQKNKAKYVVGKAELIHSVDSFELAEEINRIAQKKNVIQDVLLEVNISGEISKYGLTTDEIKDIIIKIRELAFIRVRGFMTMAPKCDEPEMVRWVFKKARELFDFYRKDNVDFDTLSMGMSGDYTVAVEEGATMVRVGSLIFGKRI